MLGYDKVIFVPSKQTYIRNEQGKDFAFDNETRLAMLEKIAENREWMEVCDYELNADHQPRTYETLCMLRDQGYEVRLLFGSDKLQELETGWKHIPELCREFGIAVMSRDDDDAEQIIASDPYLSSLKEYMTVVKTDDAYRDISSTQVRQQIRAMLEASDRIMEMVPEELADLHEYLRK
jgi:nicotinate (nicotinamide) nucleotide adenylyltransferase